MLQARSVVALPSLTIYFPGPQTVCGVQVSPSPKNPPLQVQEYPPASSEHVALLEQLFKLELAHSLTSEQLEEPAGELSPPAQATQELKPPVLVPEGCSVFAGQLTQPRSDEEVPAGLTYFPAGQVRHEEQLC